jgi:transposase
MNAFDELKKDYTDKLKAEEENELDLELKQNAMADLKELKSILKKQNIKVITNVKKLELTVTVENKHNSKFAHTVIDSFLDKHKVIIAKLKS